MSTSKLTFTDFQNTSFQAWEEKIIKDLKGKSIDDITSINWEGIKVTPHIDKEAITNYASLKTSEGWLINRTITVTSDTEANKLALKALENGANSITFIGDVTSLEVLLEGILIDIITIHFRTNGALSLTSELKNYCLNKNIDFKTLSGSITYLSEPTVEDLDLLVNELNETKLKCLWIDSNQWLNKGANSTLQIGLGLAQVNEYLGRFGSKIASKIIFEVSLGHDYFVETAKINTLRHMASSIFSEYDLVSEIAIIGTVSQLFWSDEDVENNLLRGSMAGAIGGVDELTIPSFDQSDSINSFRLSDNIQHMLKEESNIHWISNAPEGSYYLNYLTNEIIDKSWSFFQKIEALGGYSKLPSTNLSSWLKNSADALCQLVNSDQLKVIGITVYNDSKRQLNYNGEKFNWR